DAAFAEVVEVHAGAQAATDQALNLLDPAVHAAATAVAFRACLRAPRQHRVFGGHPAAPRALAKLRGAFLHGGRAEHARLAHGDARTSLRVRQRVQLDRGFADLVGSAAVGTHQRWNTLTSTCIEAS